ncbi:MAG: beta-lactamase domain protein [Conexibacter sp.]|nr:beta-lactamase domain protein [Conexibacter sp.]
MRLYVLSLGTTDVDKGVLLTPGVDVGTRVVTPVPAYLIETDAGERVLIDSGLHPGHIENPSMTWAEVPELDAILRPAMGPEHTIEHQLGLIGLTPDDVTHVVSSHLHFDHCGQHLRFAQQPILVSGRHLEAARESPAFPPRYWDLPELDYVVTDGETELFGGVAVVETPGHAPHHRSFVVDLPATGNVVLCIDAILSHHQLERDDFSDQVEPEAARESAHRLARIARTAGAPLLFGHDPDQWATIRHAPDFYA